MKSGFHFPGGTLTQSVMQWKVSIKWQCFHPLCTGRQRLGLLGNRCLHLASESSRTTSNLWLLGYLYPNYLGSGSCCHLQSAESNSLAGIRKCQLKEAPPGVDLYPDMYSHATRESEKWPNPVRDGCASSGSSLSCISGLWPLTIQGSSRKHNWPM